MQTRIAVLCVAPLLVGPTLAQVMTPHPSAPHGRAPRVNAPVAPEAIYVGRGGSTPGLSVIDLNGFGQGTGDLRNTHFTWNPNLGAPGVFPTLAPGVSNADAGGAGALTLTLDEGLGSRFLGRAIGSVADMQLGHPLDLVYNNENVNPNAASSNQVNPATFRIMPGNTISVAPHPNPPRIVVPSPNPQRFIDTEQPTVTTLGPVRRRVTVSVPPCLLGSPLNKLGEGNPFSNNRATLGLFGVNYDKIFFGPNPRPGTPAPPPAFCPFTSRQQIGHFLYVLDRPNRTVLVVNSNRFTVLARIRLPDPVSMAMHPNLKVLAVSNSSTGTVSFLDTDPSSPRFHALLATARVGRGPAGLAWQPEGEDLLVANRTDNSVSIVSGVTFQTRRRLTNGIRNPIDVAVTLRQFRLGWKTSTYFAYILNGDGSLTAYESGPTPVGPDASRPTGLTFSGARAIQPGLTDFQSACWITHQDASGLGQVSRVQLQLDRARQRSWVVRDRFGGLNATTPIRDLLSGNAVVDLAFDEILNVGALPDYKSAYLTNLVYARHSGKGQAKRRGDLFEPAHTPRFLFVALADTGKVDVLEIDTGRRIRTLDVAGVTSLGHYWRQ